ncbi:hypothetical protein [Actinomadura sp. 3N508]|uniref:hypothetical protein n=1 Tax=Actinomadura sp. 3N508 TaxID=3375153 RepID=UPI003787CC72
MYQAGLAAFTVASLACGLAPDTWTLVAFRFLQGAAAALLGTRRASSWPWTAPPATGEPS